MIMKKRLRPLLRRQATNLRRLIHRTVFRTWSRAHICGGLRQIAVDAEDRRAQKMLLNKGPKYYSKNQGFIYCCIVELPVDLLMDVGVNYGECLFAVPKGHNLRIRGFEANSDFARFIDLSSKLNPDIKDLNVSYRAMSESPGQTITFYMHREWSGKSSAVSMHNKKKIIEKKVKTTTIDDEITKTPDVRCVLIKIDVEGFEPNVIAGAATTNASELNLIYLMEFDASYLTKGGQNPRSFFDSLASIFNVFELKSSGLAPVNAFEALTRQETDPDNVHVDLVMTRFVDEEISDVFDRAFIGKNLRKKCQELWM